MRALSRNDLEAIRDHNLRAGFGAFNAMKNHGAYSHLYKKDKPHATAELYWMACIGGPRETLQLLAELDGSKLQECQGKGQVKHLTTGSAPFFNARKT